MKGKCNKPECSAPKGLCLEHVTHEFRRCENWSESVKASDNGKSKKENRNSRPVPWDGTTFQPTDLEIVSERSIPQIIGMIGNADAGKTSYLGMLYTLLFNGKKFGGWDFVGSYTLSEWETLAQYLKIKPDGKIQFAPPTPSNTDFYSLSHFAVRNSNNMLDIFFADTSGEVFSTWSEDTTDPRVENARWIYKNASAFIFMVDSVFLIEKRGIAKTKIVQMAEQVAANLNSRPVAIVWTKADRIEEIKSNIKISLEEDLKQIFPSSKIFEVSNFSKSDPDILCHKNNLAVTEYILADLVRPKELDLALGLAKSGDFFFDYKGKHVG